MGFRKRWEIRGAEPRDLSEEEEWEREVLAEEEGRRREVMEAPPNATEDMAGVEVWEFEESGGGVGRDRGGERGCGIFG